MVNFPVVLKLLKRFFAFDFEFFYAFVFESLEDAIPLAISNIRAIEDNTLAIIVVGGCIVRDFIIVRVCTYLVVEVRHA